MTISTISNPASAADRSARAGGAASGATRLGPGYARQTGGARAGAIALEVVAMAVLMPAFALVGYIVFAIVFSGSHDGWNPSERAGSMGALCGAVTAFSAVRLATRAARLATRKDRARRNAHKQDRTSRG